MFKITKEDVLKALVSEERGTKGAAERVIGVCKYPENYWVMPDYYYPGLDSERHDYPGDFSFKYITSNDEIIEACGLAKRGEHIFMKYIDDSCLPENIRFNGETIELEKDGVVIEVPFSLLCGIFLKAREMECKRPDILDLAGPKDNDTKERWFRNQEKIIELQQEIPDGWVESVDE